MSFPREDKHDQGYLPDGSVDRGVNSLLIGIAVLLAFTLAIMGLTAVVDSTASTVGKRLPPTANGTSDGTSTDAPRITLRPDGK